jgi:RimJ/RimL family protein N-acetyltransferase
VIGDPAYWDGGYGTDAVRTLLDHVFLQMGLKKVYLHTLVWNTRAQKCFRKCGFSECGRVARSGYDFILMEMKRPDKLHDAARSGTSAPGSNE